MENFDLKARCVVMSCVLYYRYSAPILEDHEFDTLCNELADNWDQLSPFRQWQLGSPDQIRASGFHVKVTVYAERGALAWHQSKLKCLPLDYQQHMIAEDEWKFDEEHQVRWVNLG